MLTDAELVNAVRAGDRAAFAILVDRYERAVWTRAWNVLRDYHTSQDVTQDTFFEAFRQIAQLRRPESFGLWLMRIADHESIRAGRRKSRLTTIEVAEFATEAAAADLPDDMANLLAQVGGLPDHERTVVTLRYLEGHSVAEVARLTARPIGTVTKQISRALERLKSVMREVNT